MKRTYHKWFPVGGFARKVTTIAAGTLSAQVLGLLAAPVLTRLYSPADFGAFQVFLSILNFLLVIVTLRYELAILLPEKESEALNLVAISLISVGVIASGTACVVWYIRAHTALLAQYGQLRTYLWVLPISVLGMGLYQTVSLWALRKQRFRSIANSKFSQVGSQIAFQLGTGFGHLGVFGLLLGDAVGRFVSAATLGAAAIRQEFRYQDATRLSGIKAMAQRYRSFPILSAPSGLLNVAGFSIPILLLGSLFGANVIGWYALVNRVLGIPSTLVGQAVSQVYMVEVSQLGTSNPPGLKRMFKQTMQKMLFLGLPPCFVFTLIAPWLFGRVFGPNWREAGIYAQFLTAQFYAGFLDSPLANHLQVLELQSWQFGWDLGRLVATMLTIEICAHLGMSPRNTIFLFSVVMFFGYLAHIGICYLAINERIARWQLRQVNTAATRV